MSPNAPKTPVHGFRIPDNLYYAAQECAERDGKTVSDVVRECLVRYVARAQKRQAAAGDDS